VSRINRKILLLGLGNDILGDDGVGLVAARLLKGEFEKGVDIIEASVGGFALLDVFQGYEKVLLLDAIATGDCSPGTILEFSEKDFQKLVAPSPHFAGLPEIFEVAKKLGVPFPNEVRILAMEVEDPYRFREALSPSVEKALPAFIESARQILKIWRCN